MRREVLLVCSCGGHLMQLHALSGAWRLRSRVWVTLDGSDARSLLADEEVVFAHGPTNRSLTKLVRNLFLALDLLVRVRPKAIVTTGAGVAVPFAWLGRILRIPVVYVESATRIETPSLSLRLARSCATKIYVQWPELREAIPEAAYAGSVLEAA